ncbi:MAG: helix-turn-helix domain-containing protein [Parvularculaceae bacterium]
MYELEKSPEGDVLAMINEVPKAFFRLSAIAETVFADLGVSASERGVMRTLFIDGERTAPDLARMKPVTRQAAQSVLDGLVAKGLVEAIDNPRHKRSKLYVLTRDGIDLCVRLQDRELDAIRALLPTAGAADFAGAAEALRVLSEALAARLDLAEPLEVE